MGRLPVPGCHPAVGLGFAFAVMVLLSSAATVPLRAATTELFPTALHTTLSGWTAIAGASGVVIGYFTSSALTAVFGGLPTAVSRLSLSLVAASLIFLLAFPESRGLELESTDGEHPRETTSPSS